MVVVVVFSGSGNNGSSGGSGTLPVVISGLAIYSQAWGIHPNLLLVT
jgi:hypothetical protein